MSAHAAALKLAVSSQPRGYDGALRVMLVPLAALLAAPPRNLDPDGLKP
jgi:hypothetical protein